jgi:hypothetical protein
MHGRSISPFDRTSILGLACVSIPTARSSAKPAVQSAPAEVCVVTLHSQAVTILIDVAAMIIATTRDGSSASTFGTPG